MNKQNDSEMLPTHSLLFHLNVFVYRTAKLSKRILRKFIDLSRIVLNLLEAVTGLSFTGTKILSKIFGVLYHALDRHILQRCFQVLCF